MKFSNEEIEEYLINSILEKGIDKSKIRRLSEEGEEIAANSSKETIETVVFDGDEENLFITFYGIHTSIFVKDYEINKLASHSEIRALDEAIKARRAAGLRVSEKILDEMYIYNIDLRAARRIKQLLPKCRCPNCQVITDGINTLIHK